MFNIPCHKGNENQKDEIPPHSSQNSNHQENQQQMPVRICSGDREGTLICYCQK
jgi:hypothetical protein